jgi:hypothetical protein
LIGIDPQLVAGVGIAGDAASEGGVAYVSGRPFCVEDMGQNELRLSFHIERGSAANGGRAAREGRLRNSLVAV